MTTFTNNISKTKATKEKFSSTSIHFLMESQENFLPQLHPALT